MRAITRLLSFISARSIAVDIAILAGLYLIGLSNYLLFHSLVELFGIVISAGIFFIAWNTRDITRNSYLLFLGIAFIFVALLDTLHMLAFRGMGVFRGGNADLAAQIWMCARFIQATTFLIAPLFLRRRTAPEFFLAGYALASALLLLSIFAFRVFPVTYVEGMGLTPFKILGEYVISAVFLAAIAAHVWKRRALDRLVFRLIVLSIAAAVVSELSMTQYFDVEGFANFLGHVLKVISFYFLYRAIIYTALAKPYDLLFRELKEREQRLRRERDRARSYFDIAGVMLVVIGADQRVRRINRKGEAILDSSADEIIGKNWFDSFIPASNREEMRGLFLRMIRGNDLPDNTPEGYENPILTSRGEERLIAWNNALLRDKQGHITGTLSSGEDITERRRAEEALRYRELFENVEDAVFIVDRGERFVEANDRVFGLTGYSREELFELGVRGIVAPGQLSLIENIEQELNRKKRLHFEFSFRTRDGAILPLFLSCKVAPYRGESAYLCVARDITDLKRLQERAIRSERLAATGEMAASIVHEIKNPLAIIGGFARSIVKRPEDAERSARNASIIADEIERMEHLVADMLDFSRPQLPRREPADVVAFITDILALLEKDITSRDVTVETEFSPEQIEFSLDVNQFKQVLINIIQNALNAMPEGGRLRVRAILNESGLGIEVIDTGKGIPPEFLERVFEPFFTTRGKGTGLGLAISQRIVQGHGGAITLASEEEKGTTVHIQLPK